MWLKIQVKMFAISTVQTLMRFLFVFWANKNVQMGVEGNKIFPEGEKDELKQVMAEEITLTLNFI